MMPMSVLSELSRKLIPFVLLLSACSIRPTSPTPPPTAVPTALVKAPLAELATPDVVSSLDVDDPAKGKPSEQNQPVLQAQSPSRNEDLFALFLTEADSNPPRVNLLKATAGRLENANCEDRLCSQVVYQLSYPSVASDITFEGRLFYYFDPAQVDERIETMHSPAVIGGMTLIARPLGSNLPNNTIILELDNTHAISTWYGPWEILIFTENPDLERQPATQILARMAEIQISKLQKAGY